MDKLEVKHTLSSTHNPQSNGGAERVCKSIHEVLEKRGGHRTDQVELSELCFKVNSHEAEAVLIKDSTEGAQKLSFQAPCKSMLIIKR